MWFTILPSLVGAILLVATDSRGETAMANTGNRPVLFQSNIHPNDISNVQLGWERPVQYNARCQIVEVGEPVLGVVSRTGSGQPVHRVDEDFLASPELTNDFVLTGNNP